MTITTQRILFRGLICFLAISTGAAFGADYSGQYSGDGMQMTVSNGPNGYTGTLGKGTTQFPFTASDNGQGFAGKFDTDQAQYQFTVTASGDELDLTTEVKTYHLHRADANPLGGDAAQGATGASAGGPAGYKVTASTQNGKAFLTTKTSGDASAAMAATLHDLKDYFGAMPKVISASADNQQPRHGLAKFSVTFNSVAETGFIVCVPGGQDGQCLVSVMYMPPNTSQEESRQLQQALTSGGAPQIPLQTLNFPDGTGSIGIANGYHTRAQSFTTTVNIVGPAGQSVVIGMVLNVQTPDSPGARQANQLAQIQHQMNGVPMPSAASRGLIVQRGTPLEMMQEVLPQLNERRRQNGSPTVEITEIVGYQPTQPQGQNGEAALVLYRAKLTTHDGNESDVKIFARIEFDEYEPGTFKYRISNVSAPESTFAQDLPIMMAMVRSQKRNYQVLTAKINEHTQEQANWFAAQQATSAQQSQVNDAQIADIQQNSIQEDRQNAGFDEVIRGTRTVQNTQTGEETQVPLGDSTAITDALNQVEPGRYKEIPLADQVAPLPNGGENGN